MKLQLFKKHIYLLPLAILFASACTQEPIFYNIMKETAPTDARIKGSPSNMVIFERQYTEGEGEGAITTSVKAMYVGSGSLHWYAQPATESEYPAWDTERGYVPQPAGGSIKTLAAAGGYLYALCGPPDGGKTLSRIGANETEWKEIATSSSYQNIFAGGDRVFIAWGERLGQADPSCQIHYVDGDEVKFLYDTGTLLLRGAAFDNTAHYLCAKQILVSSGSNYGSIYKVLESGFPEGIAPVENTNYGFMRIISLEDTEAPAVSTIIAIDRGGNIFSSDNDFAASLGTVGTSTGALGLYRQNPDSETLLLTGYETFETTITTTTNSRHGYREGVIYRTPDGSKIESVSFREPAVSVEENSEQYYSTLGQHGINHIFQAPVEIDKNRTLFASTTVEGLWSFRYRNDEYQWNAED